MPSWLLRLLTFSLPAGRILGIPLRINWLLLLYIPFFVASLINGMRGGGDLKSSAFQVGIFVIFFAVLYGSVLLHELGHAWGMHLVGESCHEIQLTPIGGVAVGGGGNHSPRTELLVVGLGPAVSLGLALAGWGLTALVDATATGGGTASYLLYSLASSIYRINLMLFLFNMLFPVFPLDSAKIFRALFSLKFNPSRVTYYLANIGIGIGVLVLIAFFLRINLPVIGDIGPMLWLIALLGIQSCIWELRMVEFADVYTTYDKWSADPIYFDSEIMTQAARRARGDLGFLAFLAPGGRGSKTRTAPSRRPAPSGRSRASFITPVAKPRKNKTPGTIRLVIPDPDGLTDPEEIRGYMEAAAEAEDFALAARLKRRLRDLSSEEPR